MTQRVNEASSETGPTDISGYEATARPRPVTISDLIPTGYEKQSARCEKSRLPGKTKFPHRTQETQPLEKLAFLA